MIVGRDKEQVKKIHVAAVEVVRKKKWKTGWNSVYHQNWWFFECVPIAQEEKWKTGWNLVYHQNWWFSELCSNQCSGRKMKDRMKLSLSPELMVFWVVFQPGWKIMGKIPPGSLCRRERERERGLYSYTTFIEDPLSPLGLLHKPWDMHLKSSKGPFPIQNGWVPLCGILHMNYFSG